jgi:hypothetical protein
MWFRRRQSGFGVTLVDPVGLEYREGERVMTFPGAERVVGGHARETGCALLKSAVRSWEPPFASEPLSDEDKACVMANIEVGLRRKRVYVAWMEDPIQFEVPPPAPGLVHYVVEEHHIDLTISEAKPDQVHHFWAAIGRELASRRGLVLVARSRSPEWDMDAHLSDDASPCSMDMYPMGWRGRTPLLVIPNVSAENAQEAIATWSEHADILVAFRTSWKTFEGTDRPARIMSAVSDRRLPAGDRGLLQLLGGFRLRVFAPPEEIEQALALLMRVAETRGLTLEPQTQVTTPAREIDEEEVDDILDRWQEAVAACESGYTLSHVDFQHDLDARLRLGQAAEKGLLTDDERRIVGILDRRFTEATVPAIKSLWPVAEEARDAERRHVAELTKRIPRHLRTSYPRDFTRLVDDSVREQLVIDWDVATVWSRVKRWVSPRPR